MRTFLSTPPAIARGAFADGPQPVLCGPGGLVLRPWEAADAPVFLAAYQDPAIRHWHTRQPQSERQVLEWFDRYRQDWAQQTGAHWAVTRDGGEVLGRVAMGGMDLDDGVAGCSYWVLPAARGAGVAPRALSTLSAWALGGARFHRLHLSHSTRNTASCRVAVKSGFLLEGTKRSDAVHADGRHDMHLHARIRGDAQHPWPRDGPVPAAATDEHWFAAFELAWEAFQERSVPVGAVLVDGTGTVVARGRNRLRGAFAPPGHLAGSRIAHAEINALAHLPPGHHDDHVLYTTLEPCFLCTMALRFSHLGTVRFAAPDTMWYGSDRLPELNQHVARRWTRREGPVGGWWQELSLLLTTVSAIERDVLAVTGAADAAPATMDLAQRLAGAPADRLRELDFREAVGDLRARIERALT